MITAAQRWGRRGGLLVCVLFAPAGLLAQNDPCDGEVADNARTVSHGYKERAKQPDMYCEGTYTKPVSGSGEVVFHPLEYSLRNQVSASGRKPNALLASNWFVVWPLTRQPVRLCGRHLRSDVFYRLDASEGTPEQADLTHMPERELFEWSTTVIGEAQQDGVLAPWADIKACVSAEPTNVARQAAPWSALPLGAEVLLPTLHLEEPPADPPDESHNSAEATVYLWLDCSKPDVQIRNVKLSPLGGGEPITPRSAPTRLGPTPARPFGFVLPANGEVYRLTFDYVGNNNRAVEAHPIYLLAPPADFAAWAQSLD